MAYADVADVTALYEGTVSTEGTPRVEALINYANAVLNTKVPSLSSRAVRDSNVADLARYVVANAVLRMLRNPGGYRTQTQTAGPFTTYLSSDASDSGIFLEEELKMLQPPARVARSVYMKIPRWLVP